MIYFDNFATTKAYDEVVEKITNTMQSYYANSSSMHRLGYVAEQIIEKEKEKITKIIDATSDEIYFTSGGTESNNLAIFGVCDAYKRLGNKIITTKIEHSSVKKCFEELEKMGFEVYYLDVDKNGYINIQNLLEQIDDNTILVSVMHINNEIGTIQNIDEIGKKIKEKNKKTIFHTDAVQGFGKIHIDTKYIDLLSASGHKIHAQKGVGMLYIKKGVRVMKKMFGAGQQNGMRAGTINTEGIVGFCTGAEITYKNRVQNFEKVKIIKNEILKLENMLDYVAVNGDKERATPYVVSLSFSGINGETLLHALDKEEIYVSMGSACNEKSRKNMSTLDYIDKERKKSTIRISFSSYNTLDEAIIFNKKILDIVPKLKMYTKI